MNSLSFIPGYIDKSSKDTQKFYFIFHDNSILIKDDNGKPLIPGNISEIGLEPGDSFYFGELKGKACYIIWLEKKISAPDNFSFINLRATFGLWDDEMFWLAGRAFHLGSWNRETKFCGRCSGRPELKLVEISKVCPDCGLTIFPCISPAVIMAVVKDGKILLGHNVRWPKPMYSTLAGFVEVGETLEECVIREVKEEAGIDVKNVKYFGSQPWHFTGSLMIGYTAEYAGGELKLDETELRDGGWYSPDNLPEFIARKPSIARQLIDWFVEKYS